MSNSSIRISAPVQRAASHRGPAAEVGDFDLRGLGIVANSENIRPEVIILKTPEPKRPPRNALPLTQTRTRFLRTIPIGLLRR